MWLIGGPVSSFLEDGTFTSPPAQGLRPPSFVHQVCPFIAAPTYSKLIEDRP